MRCPPLRFVMKVAWLAAAFGVLVLSAQQPPQVARLTGEAPPPASPLSLWYRAPASDRPMDPPRPTGQGANQEWVRALPVGNGRLGAMVFGGVVHERLQLNEDTLWAGRPYDPVNPEARAALPEVRRLLAAGQYREAASLVSEKVMAKPLAQMPYQTLGDLALTFPQVASAENYRRHLDLATATAHVSYTSSGVTFAREVFASAPDQVIVVRLTANRPGQISFEARMRTPQRASIDATDGDLVMRGVNGDGRGTTADGRPMTGALAVRGTCARRRDRRHPYEFRRCRRRPRRGRGHTAHRRGDELQELRRCQRRSGGACRIGPGFRIAQDRRRTARRARPRLSTALQSCVA